MKKNSFLSFIITLGFSLLIQAQRHEIKGLLFANGEVEGIHILNKTASKYAISNENGSFVILAKASDVLYVSGLKYQNKTIVVSQSMIDVNRISIQLVEAVTVLDEVIVGKILTGSLQSDLENSDAKTEINFYDLGIPGYTGKPLTQNERKLHDADAGPTGALMGGPYGGGVGLNVHKLLNKISGRTKTLKAIVALDNKQNCMSRLRSDYETAIFENVTLADDLKNEYFFFCDEDPEFKQICEANNDLKAIEFLQQKLIIYKENRKSETKN